MNKFNTLLTVFLVMTGLLLQHCSFTTVNNVSDDGGTSIEVVGVRGVVVGKDRQPAANASLVLQRAEADAKKTTVRGRATTAQDGGFFIPEAGCGRYLIGANDSREQGVLHGFSISVGSRGADVDTLQLRQTGSIGMTVTRMAGDGLIVQVSGFVYYHNVFSLVDTMSLQDSQRTGDTFIAGYACRSLPPDTYDAVIHVSFKPENADDTGFTSPFQMQLDTTIVIGEGEHLVLPDFRVSARLSPEMAAVYKADSTAMVSIFEKCGVRHWPMYFYPNYRTGRIDMLLITAEKEVTFTDIAAELGQLDGLHWLVLDGVKGDSLPEAITRMPGLFQLDLRNGTLTWVPPELASAPRLRYVGFINQRLSSIPSFLDDLVPGQASARLDGNPIRISSWEEQMKVNDLWVYLRDFSLPPLQEHDFGIIRNLFEENGFGGVSDSTVYMNENGRVTGIRLSPELLLRSFPPDLDTLDSLKDFSAARHSLGEVPEWFSGCPALERLELPNGNLTSLPEFLGRMRCLEFIDVANNRLTEVPGWVGKLDENRLTHTEIRGYFHADPHFRQIADFSFNRILPDAVKYAKPICVVEPQLFTGAGGPDETVFERELSIALDAVQSNRPETFWFWMPWWPHPLYSKYIRMGNDRVRSIAISLCNYGAKEKFGKLFTDLAEFDSLRTIYLDVALTEGAFNSGKLDSVLATITVRLPSVYNLVFSDVNSTISRIPSGFFEIMPNIRHVGLQNMGLKDVPDIIKTRPGIESANLFCNPLTNIDGDDRRWIDGHCKIAPVEYGNPIGYAFFPEGLTLKQSAQYGTSLH